MAFGAAATGMGGPLRWACHHRVHHRFSDTEKDPHSPVHKGYYFAHWGWVFDQETATTRYDNVKDLLPYPELMFIDKYQSKIRLGWGVTVFLLGQYTTFFGATGLGLSAFVWVYCLPVIFNAQSALIINSYNHSRNNDLFRHRRYETKDATVNSWLLSIPTMGCSWHNNHHRFMNSARAGFVWWQIDPTYMILKVLSYVGIVWDLVEVPEEIIKEGFSKASSDDSKIQRESA